MGTLPPITEAQWQEVFLKYQQFPEYKQINQGMSLSEFKFIFFWEFSHRLLGRLIGLVFFIPFLYFWAKNYFNSRLFKQLAVGLALGASQGLMGWYMVKSGLVDVPYVSHYRLAAHLILAFIIEAFLLWIIFEINSEDESMQKPLHGRAFWGSVLLSALVGLQIIYGAFVAGKKAGYGYNSFPLMNGRWLPDDVFALSPAWTNLLQNSAMLQFIHRWLAFVVLFAVIAYVILFWRHSSNPKFKAALIALPVSLVVQIALGIATLVMVVPISVAVLHQIGALFVVGALVRLVYTSRLVD